jgi:penicillin-binding protein 1C
VALAACVLAALLLAGLDRAFPPELGRAGPVGSVVTGQGGRLLALLPAAGGVWRLRTTPDDVSPVFLATLLNTEDRHFWHHPGVEPWALLRAAAQDVRAGRVVSGGSTLSMQVVRLLHPRPRSWRAKLIEIARAVQLEAHLSKRDILTLWLTLAPYGGNLQGVTAASWAWFGAPPRALDAAQSALLVAIPRRPEALRPDRHPQAARALRDRLAGTDAGPMPQRRQPMPALARLAIAPLAGPPLVRTTLDVPLQAALQALAAQRLAALPPRASLAVVVADIHDRAFRALVSGAGPDPDRAGSLDLTRAIRSPGSALKPFVYGMAFADGIAGPGTVLDDTPHRYGAYAPEDFGRDFAGPVTAAEALRRSLNLPAVALLQGVGPLRLLQLLRNAGAAPVLPPGADPSLPLALGGIGISARALAMLYADLASGQGAPLTLRPDTPAPTPFLPRAAASAVAGVLTQAFPDGGPPGVAWKTGTSWGGRDAWAAGFDARHVAVVWIGRPDGTPMPRATGRFLALPLLSAVMAMLPPAPRAAPAPVRPDLQAAAPADALRLLFPPPGAELSGDGPIVLRAMGGRRPLTFLVDGLPLDSQPARREAAWLPSPGFYRLAVIDADGHADHAQVRVR